MFRKILIADSDIEFRDELYEMFVSMAYDVECAPNSNEALARLQSERPYLLFLSDNLVPYGGLKVLEEVRKFDREIKIVLLTKGAPDPETESHANILGASAVLKKNFSDNLMFKKILEILRLTEMQTQESNYFNLGRVLIVDDSPDVRITLAAFLKMRGFNVKDVVNGEQALMEIKNEKPSLVLLDERMPGMDGLMVLRKIKETDSLIKVVMLSAIRDEDIMQEASKLGASDYITKPCDLDKLEASVLSILVPEKFKRDAAGKE